MIPTPPSCPSSAMAMVTSTAAVHSSYTSAADVEVNPSSPYLAADTSSTETTFFRPQQTPEPSDTLSTPLFQPLKPMEPSDTLSTPTESVSVDPSDDSRVPSTVGGISLPVVLIVAGVALTPVIIVTVTVTVSLARCLKSRKFNKSTPISATQAYGVILQASMEENTYSYPIVDLDDTTESMQNNEAYVTNLVTGGNETYATNIVTGGNEAYATNIVTGRNEAYATNIVPKRNEAYKTITSVNVSETADTYDYVD